MPENPLPQPLVSFIARHIQTVEQLEILCLLAENPKAWSQAEVFKAILSSEASVAQCLEKFAGAGFLRVETGGETQYRFEPQSQADAEQVAALVAAYRERRVTVIETIYQRPDPVQDFANAFRLRKDK